MKGIDSIASIVKRGKSFRAQVSLYKHGKHNKISKTFSTKKEAELWALQTELDKANGKQLAHRSTTFPVFFENWIKVVKFHDVRESTFQNYVRASNIINKLFTDVQLKDLDDIIIQRRIDEYSINHSRKTTHELLLKIKTAIRDAYARGYISNDFTPLIKTRGVDPPKRNRALSITEFRKLRKHVLTHHSDEFNLLVLLALETGMRRGELLAIKPESLYKYGIKVRHSISPTTNDTSLKVENARRDVSINEEVFNLISAIPVKSNGYLFNFDGFKQSERLGQLLSELDIPKTTFHGLRDTHASFLFAKDIDIVYVSKRLGHNDIQTTQNYYLHLMPEKAHAQEKEALDFLRA